MRVSESELKGHRRNWSRGGGVLSPAPLLAGSAIAVSLLAATFGFGWQPRGAMAAPDVTPEFFEGPGNRTCAELQGAGQTWNELKVDPNADGEFSDGTLTVTISNTTNDKTFNWSSNISVDAVFVKAGSAGSFLYRYDPPSESTGDDGLTSPGEGNAISHITFCYDLEATPTPTATPTTVPTPTPTVTATALAATQAPSPTAAALAAVQLPATGGDAGKSRPADAAAMVLAGALAVVASGAAGLQLLRGRGRAK